ncbi:hypothetical protein AXK11_08625 [Cephaloticoccus primus]|uniref:CHASE3 domain-containing protein n=1 Tax=Cephaloticoccus primus TaxID=1548207 RepID=A0A139SIP3_9BACT|nr:CHASE3 domain-containing protein [Cephaloticoccus primus]KXU34364.1 hypothetical protein AXK11_08625 [Cephaloticoccus primus]
MKDTTLQRLAYVFLFVSAILISIALLAVRNIRSTAEASDWVNHTHSLIDRIDNVRSALLRSEATLRAYAATGESGDLITLNRALGDLSGELDLALLMSSPDTEPEQYARLQEIQSLSQAHAQSTRAVIAARQAGEPHELRKQMDAFTRSPTAGTIEQGLGFVKSQLLKLLSERDTALYLQVQSTRWAIWSGVGVDLLLLVGAGWLIRDDLAHRRRATQALEDANAQLETKVAERTAELLAANEQLSLDNLERQWANQALEHQLHYNHRIVECVSDLVVVLTKAGHITRVNTAVLRHSGWDSPDLVKQPFGKLVRLLGGAPHDGSASPPPADGSGAPHGSADEGQNKRIAEAMKAGRDLVDQPALALARDGRSAPARASLYPLRDQNKIIGGILTLRLNDSPTA